MIPQSIYYDMRKLYLSGDITEDEWKDFCLCILEDLMLEHKDILVRLRAGVPP